MRRQLVPGLVVRLAVIKAKNRPGIEASFAAYMLTLRLLLSSANHANPLAGSTLIDRPKDAPVPDFTNGKERVTVSS